MYVVVFMLTMCFFVSLITTLKNIFLVWWNILNKRKVIKGIVLSSCLLMSVGPVFAESSNVASDIIIEQHGGMDHITNNLLDDFSELKEVGFVKENGSLLTDFNSEKKASSVNKDDKLSIIGENNRFYKVQMGSDTLYIVKDNIVLEKEKTDEIKEIPILWTGPKLTKSKGVNQGPSGKETYYNLPMSGVIKTMRRMGNNDKYWVREDGCKMLGDYIMIAANLKVRPRGSLVETSLGTGIVCDTGGFAKRNPKQIDIAVNW